MSSIDPTRLYTALLNTGLQSKNNPLYQVIYNLIGNVNSLSAEIDALSSGSLGPIGPQGIQGLIGPSGFDGEDLEGSIIQLIQGSGSASPRGLVGPSGMDGLDGDDYSSFRSLSIGDISGAKTLAGTANQVILSASGVNSLLGINDITLSLPQSIAITSNVQFGKIGIGVAPTRFLDILGITEQLRLSYDATHFVSLTVDAFGNITLLPNPSGASFTYQTLGTGIFSMAHSDNSTISDYIRNSNVGTSAAIEWNLGNDTSQREFIIRLDSSTNVANPSRALIQNQTGPLIFGTAGAEKMRILTGGTVGIGTVTPDTATLLDLSSSAPIFRMTDTTASAKSLYLKTDANVSSFYEAAGAAGDILSLDLTNKRVGIGTVSPAQQLDISSTAPSFQMTDTTASAKSLRLVTDANKTNLYEAAGAAGDIMTWDLANKRVGIVQGTPTAWLHLGIGASGASSAPLKFTSGTNQATPEVGTVEWDAVQLYHTIDTSSGRGAIPVQQYVHLTSDNVSIGSGITDYFGTTTSISLVSGAYYLIDIVCYFINNTAGTLTWTLTNSAAPVSQNIYFEMSPVTGIVAPPGTATMLVGQFSQDATAAKSFVTASLTNAVEHYARFRIEMKNNTGTSLKIQVTKSSGTITARIGSYWICRRISPNNIGTFAA